MDRDDSHPNELNANQEKEEFKLEALKVLRSIQPFDEIYDMDFTPPGQASVVQPLTTGYFQVIRNSTFR